VKDIDFNLLSEHARQEKHKRFFHSQKGTSNGINTGFSALL
jgi:hypothetical protein